MESYPVVIAWGSSFYYEIEMLWNLWLELGEWVFLISFENVDLIVTDCWDWSLASLFLLWDIGSSALCKLF
jgi:hypothetical protein